MDLRDRIDADGDMEYTKDEILRTAMEVSRAAVPYLDLYVDGAPLKLKLLRARLWGDGRDGLYDENNEILLEAFFRAAFPPRPGIHTLVYRDRNYPARALPGRMHKGEFQGVKVLKADWDAYPPFVGARIRFRLTGTKAASRPASKPASRPATRPAGGRTPKKAGRKSSNTHPGSRRPRVPNIPSPPLFPVSPGFFERQTRFFLSVSPVLFCTSPPFFLSVSPVFLYVSPGFLNVSPCFFCTSAPVFYPLAPVFCTLAPVFFTSAPFFLYVSPGRPSHGRRP